MPPAKKPAPRRRASAAKATPSAGQITRKEVEQATARFEKALDEATQALQAMRNDLGKGAHAAYKDIAAALRTLRANAKKSNRAVLKDIEKLASSVTSATKSVAPAGRGRSRTDGDEGDDEQAHDGAQLGREGEAGQEAPRAKSSSASTARKSTAAKSTTAKRDARSRAAAK